jgi:hypothetical protein
MATMMCRKRPILVDAEVKPKRSKVILVDAEVKPKRSKVILVDTSYTPLEVNEMNEYRIVGEFMRITGCEELTCTHCKRTTNVKTKWVVSVVKRCQRDGIYKDMKVPKTCDEMQGRNMISNPVNNPIYPKLDRRAKEILEREERNRLIQKRMDGLKKVKIDACPYKYVIEHL